MTGASFYEPTDIAHVQAKHGKADPSLVVLLGKANTRRRQYFKYRESHHKKLARGLDIDFDTGKTTSEQQSTVASSIPDGLKTSSLGLAIAVDADELSDSGFTQTSYASSANISDRPRFPALPSEAANGPFQCPFCFGMITVTTSYAWRKHIFADLRPYICGAVDCPVAGTEFGRRYQWMQHMLQNHWRKWHCVFCVDEPFTSTSRLRDHLQCLHAEAVLKEGIETTIQICGHSGSFNAETKCPLCDCSLESVKTYCHHMGRHLEDIALFVLPHIPGQDGVSDDENTIGSSSELDTDYVHGDYEEQIQIQDASESQDITRRLGSTSGQWHVPSESPGDEQEKTEGRTEGVDSSDNRLDSFSETVLRRLTTPAPTAVEHINTDDFNLLDLARVRKRPSTFQCTLCPKRLARAYNLRSHLRTHTDEKPFVCTVCGKAFARQHDRKRHEGLHTGDKEVHSGEKELHSEEKQVHSGEKQVHSGEKKLRSGEKKFVCKGGPQSRGAMGLWKTIRPRRRIGPAFSIRGRSYVHQTSV